TYRHLTTAWCESLADTWWRPRCDCPDPDWPAPPADEATLRSLCATRVPALKKMIAGSRPFVRPGPGEGVPSSPLEQSVKDALAGPLRERTLILISHSCPYFLEQLTAEEQQLYAQLAPATVRALERVGVSALDIGPSLSTRHYCDAVHLTAEG